HHGHELRNRHPGQKRPNREWRLGLAHEDRRRHVETLGPARSHDLVHRDRERLDDDLHDAEVVHDREQRRHEDDRRHDLEGEDDTDTGVLLADFAEHEFGAGAGEAEDVRHGGAQQIEDHLTDGYAQYEDREHVLKAYALRDLALAYRTS